ncbi:tRNA 2-selenouridine(34) synthase MnmH [Candidatus Woesearchaeota archaeon]|nr:tRNA 2-selenouridine(34) synthase MnmH [Candidatus Woesearchaeota archaeon]
MPQTISIKEALELENTIFIDTRTPAEYAEAHIPDAVNIPIFSNDERALIGTIYTKINKEQAIDKGVELFSQKLPDILKQMKQYKDKTIIINCWRGGMRSKVVTNVLCGLGYRALQLEGGHKAYRKYVIEQLNNYQFKARFIVLYGLTGTGKTELLKQFPNSLDLEDLAQHRNSRLGMVGLQPRNQKMFDAMILQRFRALQNKEFIIIEGESRKLGRVLLPESLYKAMKKGINIKVELPIETRCKRLADEYFDTIEKIQQIKEIVKTMIPVLSNKIVDEIITAINSQDYEEAVRLLLVHFYDPKYNHTVENIDYQLKVNNDITKVAEEIRKFLETY